MLHRTLCNHFWRHDHFASRRLQHPSQTAGPPFFPGKAREVKGRFCVHRIGSHRCYWVSYFSFTFECRLSYRLWRYFVLIVTFTYFLHDRYVISSVALCDAAFTAIHNTRTFPLIREDTALNTKINGGLLSGELSLSITLDFDVGTCKRLAFATLPK